MRVIKCERVETIRERERERVANECKMIVTVKSKRAQLPTSQRIHDYNIYFSTFLRKKGIRDYFLCNRLNKLVTNLNDHRFLFLFCF